MGRKGVVYVNTVCYDGGVKKCNIRKALNSTNMCAYLKNFYANKFNLESHEQLIGREFMCTNKFLLSILPVCKKTIYNWLSRLEKEGKIKLLYKKMHGYGYIVFLQ